LQRFAEKLGSAKRRTSIGVQADTIQLKIVCYVVG
jgi:hypothetical protein